MVEQVIEERVTKSYPFLENFEQWLQSVGLTPELAQFSKVAISIVAIIVIAILANYITKKIIVAGLTKLSRKTKSVWDDYLVERKVLRKLSHLAPALVIQFTIGVALYDYSPSITLLVEKFTYIYIAAVCVLVLSSFLDAMHDIYQTLEVSKTRPIKGYVQLLKIVVYIFGGIIVISILFNKNPMNLLVGMGASAAILMLVFKDTILGLVASVQVSANNMVKPGDWIEMPSRKADGTVLEITLNTVKVQNWDRTISTIPTYALVSESFTNWKGMEESDGRRIKRSIYIDMRSVKFCPPELIEKLKRIHFVKDYIEQRSKEIEEFNVKMGYDTTMPVNGRRMTNLGIFRRYLEFYLKNNPKINQGATLMVRQLQPTEQGIPIEIYCFSTEKAWVIYEGVQADIFDHVLSVVPEFELRIFQNPSGEDFQRLVN
ncbi:MAG TPA: mechanosensitive ion channel [Tenuifilaceae bacterium]|nr:mechanosensitive ion channel [Tenuifilaceae bacterium]HPE19595.1 mechanosensitive ion channel [Tenuifilaceae bacterium]HPQ35865.1 mechanosensitive ion channel [Tenuifilaceae bacterium]